ECLSPPSHLPFSPPRALPPPDPHPFPTRRSSDLRAHAEERGQQDTPGERTPEPLHFGDRVPRLHPTASQTHRVPRRASLRASWRSEEHTSELQSRENLVCRLLLEKKKTRQIE